MTSLWKWSDSFFYLARQKVCIYKRHSEHSSAVRGRTENAIFNSDLSIPPIQVFQYNHTNTDLKGKKDSQFLLTPAEKEGVGRKKLRECWIQLPSTLRPLPAQGSTSKAIRADYYPEWKGLKLCNSFTSFSYKFTFSYLWLSLYWACRSHLGLPGEAMRLLSSVPKSLHSVVMLWRMSPLKPNFKF